MPAVDHNSWQPLSLAEHVGHSAQWTSYLVQKSRCKCFYFLTNWGFRNIRSLLIEILIQLDYSLHLSKGTRIQIEPNIISSSKIIILKKFKVKKRKSSFSPKSMSKVKNTLVMILKQEIQDLHQGVVQMDEDSLVKQVAKNKIIFNLTKKSNSLQLVYSYIALAQYYISNQIYEPALKTLLQSQQVKETGDASYLMGICLFKIGKKIEANRILAESLKSSWIEPSAQHQQSNQLECISYMQKIEYERYQKHPDKSKQYQQKLVQLSYQKIKLIKKFDALKNQNRGDNYYYALAMGDLAEIYSKFENFQSASQKIKTAIKMLQGENAGGEKLIQFYLTSALISQKLKQPVETISDLKSALQLVEESKKNPKSLIKFNKTHQQIYYLYIKTTLGV